MVEKQVRCAHILQKHTESRNPFDRARNKKVIITINKNNYPSFFTLKRLQDQKKKPSKKFKKFKNS